MPIYMLNDQLVFPRPDLADDATGILAVGGDLSVPRLVQAYRQGIFPWYDEDYSPILWHSPAWRMVLPPDQLHVARSLKKTLRRAPYTLRYNTAFSEVLQHCAAVPRPDQDGTWLNPDMRAAYERLHAAGHAHSAEAWDGDRLVGGLYGVTMGGTFFGESMFALAPNASKVVFVTLVRALGEAGYSLVDCQVHTDHLSTFGAVEWPRHRFLKALAAALPYRPDPVWPGSGQMSTAPSARQPSDT
ncbi:MAG: leucyl/phenylalanyl-tRNA--protein transferase [Bradymonadia bacterium]|jgi:leucyl/phenylalanyl-tRNA--protein transferase